MTDITYYDLEMMYMTGLREVVSPVNYTSAAPVSANTIIDAWNQQLEIQIPRARGMMVKVHAMLGISMVSVPKNWEDLLPVLPEYLKKDEVVAIGEIGFQPGSATCRDLDVQEKIVRAQIEIAKECGVPIVFHTPNDKVLYTDKCLSACAQAGLPFERVLIDHCSEDNIAMVLDSGAWCGITVQPWRGLTPKIAAGMVMKYGPERICLDSDVSRLESDALSVPKTAFQLAKSGCSEEIIGRVAGLNAKEFYGI